MTLDEIRENIDRVDKQIKILFRERMLLADNVAGVKAETEDDIYKPEREEAIINSLTKDVEDNIKMEYTALIKRIMEISRKYQYGRTLELRDCLNLDMTDLEPSVTKLAMIKSEVYICNGYSRDSVCAVDNFRQAAQMVNDGTVSAGMGILEDISYGVSDGLHEALTDSGLFIYRCNVVQDGDHRKKVVAFSRQLVVRPEHNRIKVMFVCGNKSGSLGSVLSMISDYGVNLTEIHSVPDRRTEWNYRFYLEFSANLMQKEIQALIFQLQNETEIFQILGSYSCEGDF